MPADDQVFESNPEEGVAAPVRAVEKKFEDVIENDFKADESFARFAGTHFSSAEADFTDKVVKKSYQRRDFTQQTFQTRPTYYESPNEKLARLNAELKQFRADMEALAKTGGSAQIDEVSKLLVGETDTLGKQLDTIAKTQSFSPFLDSHYPLTPASVGAKNTTAELKTRLTAFKSGAKPAVVAPEQRGVLTYELYRGGGGGKVDAVGVDKRLSAVEATVGSMQVLPVPDIETALTHISRRLEGLDSSKVEAATRKMKGLLEELDQLEVQKKAITGAKPTEHQKKITDTFALLPRYEVAAQQLPLLVQRLLAIKDIKTEAASAMARVDKAEKAREAATTLTKANAAQLEKVTKVFGDLLTEVDKQVATLDKTFGDLTAKMQKVK